MAKIRTIGWAEEHSAVVNVLELQALQEKLKSMRYAWGWSLDKNITLANCFQAEFKCKFMLSGLLYSYSAMS